MIISGNKKPSAADQENNNAPSGPSYPANFATLSKYNHIKDA